MAITVQNIIDRVQRLLKDDGTRWTTAELIDWVNDAQREVVLYKPDASSKITTFACALGAKQTLPSDGIQLLDVINNSSGAMRAIKYVTREVLDSENPNWRSETPSSEIRNFTFDEKTPRDFYVYPPAATATSIEISYSVSPAEVSSVSDPISLPDVYANAIVYFVLYRALSKNADYAADYNQAQGYYNMFLQVLTGKSNAETAVAPSVDYNRAPAPEVR